MVRITSWREYSRFKLEAAQAGSKAVVAGDLLQRDALVAHAIGDPTAQGRVGLQQHRERASGTVAATVAAEFNPGSALVVGDASVGHQAPPAEHTAVLVGREAALEQTVELTAMDARARQDLGERCGGRLQMTK